MTTKMARYQINLAIDRADNPRKLQLRQNNQTRENLLQIEDGILEEELGIIARLDQALVELDSVDEPISPDPDPLPPEIEPDPPVIEGIHARPEEPTWDMSGLITLDPATFRSTIESNMRHGQVFIAPPGDYGSNYRGIAITEQIMIKAQDSSNPPRFWQEVKPTKGVFNTTSLLTGKWFVIDGAFVDSIRNSSGNGGLVRGQGGNIWLENIKSTGCHTLCLSKPINPDGSTDMDSIFVALNCNLFATGGEWGRAHGVYVWGGHCYIEGTTIIDKPGGTITGHAVKSLCQITTVRDCILGSADGKFSYLAEASGLGGEFLIEGGELHNPAASDNRSTMVNYDWSRLGNDPTPDKVIIRNLKAVNHYKGSTIYLLTNRVDTVTPVIENVDMQNPGGADNFLEYRNVFP